MSDQQEPAITYEHVIGVQTLENFALRKENAGLQQMLKEQQELITELRAELEPKEADEPTPLKRSS